MATVKIAKFETGKCYGIIETSNNYTCGAIISSFTTLFRVIDRTAKYLTVENISLRNYKGTGKTQTIFIRLTPARDGSNYDKIEYINTQYGEMLCAHTGYIENPEKALANDDDETEAKTSTVEDSTPTVSEPAQPSITKFELGKWYRKGAVNYGYMEEPARITARNGDYVTISDPSRKDSIRRKIQECIMPPCEYVRLSDDDKRDIIYAYECVDEPKPETKPAPVEEKPQVESKTKTKRTKPITFEVGKTYTATDRENEANTLTFTVLEREKDRPTIHVTGTGKYATHDYTGISNPIFSIKENGQKIEYMAFGGYVSRAEMTERDKLIGGTMATRYVWYADRPDAPKPEEPKPAPKQEVRREAWQEHTCWRCEHDNHDWTHEQFTKGILLSREYERQGEHCGLSKWFREGYSLTQLYKLAKFFGLTVPSIKLTSESKTLQKAHQISELIANEIHSMEHVYVCTYETINAPALPVELADKPNPVPVADPEPESERKDIPKLEDSGYYEYDHHEAWTYCAKQAKKHINPICRRNREIIAQCLTAEEIIAVLCTISPMGIYNQAWYDGFKISSKTPTPANATYEEKRAVQQRDLAELYAKLMMKRRERKAKAEAHKSEPKTAPTTSEVKKPRKSRKPKYDESNQLTISFDEPEDKPVKQDTPKPSAPKKCKTRRIKRDYSRQLLIVFNEVLSGEIEQREAA